MLGRNFARSANGQGRGFLCIVMIFCTFLHVLINFTFFIFFQLLMFDIMANRRRVDGDK